MHTDTILEKENTDIQVLNEGAPSRSSLPSPGRLFAVTLVVLLPSVCFWIGWRAYWQRTRVTALLHFDVSVEARYGAYIYEPPPSTSGTLDGGTFTIWLGRGQRARGFSVVDDLPQYLSWVPSVLGEHSFARVTDVTVRDAGFSDADVELLLGFPDLQAIDVSATAITDAGLIKLASLDRLVLLDVSDTRVSGESLRHLVDCHELKELDIRDTDADVHVVTLLAEALPDCWIRWHDTGD